MQAFPSSPVTLEDEVPKREKFRQSPLRSALERK